jgi:5-methylcytosine-specific restriction endonuclease McrA
MSRLPKAQSDLVKRGQGWRCGNKKCPHGKTGKPASIKSGGHIHHKNGDPTDHRIGNLIALCPKCHRQVKKRRGVEHLFIFGQDMGPARYW